MCYSNNVKHGELHRALSLFPKVRGNDTLTLSRSTFITLLKACTARKDLEKGRALHATICRQRLFEKDVFIASILIDMYAKCGALKQAQLVFDVIPTRDVVIWTALIGGYAKQGDFEKALTLLQQMQDDGIGPDETTLLCCLKACGSAESLFKGQELHFQVILRGLEGESAIGNTVVYMYAKCGMLDTAQDVFNSLPAHNVVSWTALIGGYAEHGHGEEALYHFQQMQIHHRCCSNAITFVCILKACGTIGAIDDGQAVHSEIVKKGLEAEILVRNTLVHLYSKWGLLDESHVIMGNLSSVDVVICNALLSGYAEHGRIEEAMAFLEKMQQVCIAPNAITFVCCLKACGCFRVTGKGIVLHTEATKRGLEREMVVGSTLADIYARSGLLVEAQAVFDTLESHDVISWTALMTGYAECEQGGDALRCLEQMQMEGVCLNATTFISALKACGSTGAVAKGAELHIEVIRRGLESDLPVCSSLVHMYAKCGLTREAEDVFKRLPDQDEVSFNMLIAAYAQVGESDSVFFVFEKMIEIKKAPDMVTFVGVLNAFSHAALVDESLVSLKVLIHRYGMIPSLEHFSCMIDLFGRVGSIGMMAAMVINMPFHPGIVEWLTVLSACRKWYNVNLGRQAFENAIELDEANVGAYTSMYNVYADVFLQGTRQVVAMGVAKMKLGMNVQAFTGYHSMAKTSTMPM